MAVNITVSCTSDEPMFLALVKLVANNRVSSTISSPINTPSTTVSNEIDLDQVSMEVGLVLQRLGTVSKEFIRAAADACNENGNLSFTIGDIAVRLGKDEKAVRATNRNINRSMNNEGVRLWETKWDHDEGHMVFTIKSQKHLDAMLDSTN